MEESELHESATGRFFHEAYPLFRGFWRPEIFIFPLLLFDREAESPFYWAPAKGTSLSLVDLENQRPKVMRNGGKVRGL